MSVSNNVQSIAQAVADRRQRPLLILYWPDESHVQENDVRDLRKFLRNQQLTRTRKTGLMDVLIETVGGETNVPYLIGQMIHDYAEKIAFLVPNKALSAGAEICLAGHRIIFGEDAVLSPIDTIYTDEEGKQLSETTIEHFRELADESSEDATRSAIVENTIGRIEHQLIADTYRESRVAGRHAQKLLQQYMLKDSSEETITSVLEQLTTQAPSHDWRIDYHIAKEIGLKAERMDEETSDTTKDLAKQIMCEIVTGDRNDGKTGNAAYFLYVTPTPSAPLTGS